MTKTAMNIPVWALVLIKLFFLIVIIIIITLLFLSPYGSFLDFLPPGSLP